MIVGICGSPRQQATEHVLKEALRMLEKKVLKRVSSLSEEKTSGSALTATTA